MKHEPRIESATHHVVRLRHLTEGLDTHVPSDCLRFAYKRLQCPYNSGTAEFLPRSVRARKFLVSTIRFEASACELALSDFTRVTTRAYGRGTVGIFPDWGRSVGA